eukprot:2753718-Pleurochrysis_carterae.AAC.2
MAGADIATSHRMHPSRPSPDVKKKSPRNKVSLVVGDTSMQRSNPQSARSPLTSTSPRRLPDIVSLPGDNHKLREQLHSVAGKAMSSNTWLNIDQHRVSTLKLPSARSTPCTASSMSQAADLCTQELPIEHIEMLRERARREEKAAIKAPKNGALSQGELSRLLSDGVAAHSPRSQPPGQRNRAAVVQTAERLSGADKDHCIPSIIKSGSLGAAACNAQELTSAYNFYREIVSLLSLSLRYGLSRAVPPYSPASIPLIIGP